VIAELALFAAHLGERKAGAAKLLRHRDREVADLPQVVEILAETLTTFVTLASIQLAIRRLARA
jgi:hypothetical protein